MLPRKANNNTSSAKLKYISKAKHANTNSSEWLIKSNIEITCNILFSLDNFSHDSHNKQLSDGAVFSYVYTKKHKMQ